MTVRKWAGFCSTLLSVGISASALRAQTPAVQVSATVPAVKQRLFVLSDIEADPDDSQSFIRLLLYANELEIESLAATTSTHQRTLVSPQTMQKLIDAYAQVHPNLLLHDKSYPAPQALRALVTSGPPLYGMLGVGDGHDSEASNRLIRALERNDPRPLWVPVWGGPNVLAQALFRIRATRSAAEAERLYSKLRVYTISDQDDSAQWIRQNFPSVWYIVSPGGYGSSTWNGIRGNVAGAPAVINAVVTNDWITENLQQGHGPLGAQYPDVAYGMEGDTPSFLGLIPNGLNNMNFPNWGGWGGRYELYTPRPPATPQGNNAQPPQPETRPIWTNADDVFRPSAPRAIGRAMAQDTTRFTGNTVTVWRWREDFQNDFAARMDWTVKSREEANHAPVPMLATPDTFTVKSGETFKLDAWGTYDPDGDGLSYFWMQYPEAGTYREIVPFGPRGNLSPNLYNVHTIIAPQVTSRQTIHFILSVTDKGSPALTRYRRVIVTVVP
jgi:hypothetical protein